MKTLSINGTNYDFPETGDKPWSDELVNAITALANSNNTLYVNSIVNDDTTGGAAVPASAEIVKTHGTEIDGKIAKSTATTKGDILAATAASTVTRLGIGTNDQVLTADSAEATGMKWATPGVGSVESNPSWEAGSFFYPTSNPAPLDVDTSFTNGILHRHLFDDTTNESILGVFKVPSDIGTGNVTFKLYGYPVTAASANVVFVIGHSAVSNDADIDAVFSYVSSGTKAVIITQDDLNVITWTETVANLGWIAGQQCRIILLRDPAGSYTGADTLSGDYALTYFEIDIPRA